MSSFPKDVTHTMGVVDTADGGSASINPLQPFTIGSEVYRINPDEHQLLTWAMRNGRTKPTETHKFGHAERPLGAQWVRYMGATETSSQATTGLTITGGATKLARGYRVYNPRTEETMRFTADFASADTSAAVARNFGSSGTPYLHKGDYLLISAPAKMEGDTMTKGMQSQESWKSFTTSIVDYPVEMTGTKATERHSDGDPFVKALDDSWEYAARQMEAELLTGGYVEDTSTYTYPMHATGGIMNHIETHVWIVDGYLTRWDLWDMIAEWCGHNKTGGAIACSGQMISLFTTWAFAKVQYNQNLQSDGINIYQITTPRGTFDLLEIDLFGQDPYLAGTMLFLPKGGKPTIEYRPLEYNGSRDVAYLPVETDGTDLKQGQIFGEYGWHLKMEQRFGIAKGIKF